MLALCQGMKCRNTMGSYQCYCEVGCYANGSNACTDINECLSNPCEDVCMNNEGSYECACKDGYGLTATNGVTSCVDIDECLSNPCEHNCNNTVGSYHCLPNVNPQFSTTTPEISSLPLVAPVLSTVTTIFIVITCLQTLIIILCLISFIIACACMKCKHSKSTPSKAESN